MLSEIAILAWDSVIIASIVSYICLWLLLFWISEPLCITDIADSDGIYPSIYRVEWHLKYNMRTAGGENLPPKDN